MAGNYGPICRRIWQYATPEQKADLDIKTSKNLIGEVVNLSQLLNSILWDKYNTTNVMDYNIYADICTLDVLSGLEIDKAKKEVKINTKAELTRLKQKYKDYLKPMFFKSLKQKYKVKPVIIDGTEKQTHKFYATAMDYIVSNITTNAKKMKSKHLDSVEVMDLLSPSILISNADRKQIQRIYDSIIELKQTQNAIWKDKILGADEKWQKNNELQTECINRWKGKITATTIKKIIKLCYTEGNNYTTIKRKVMVILFAGNKAEFIKAITPVKEPIQTLRRCDYCKAENNVTLYNINFNS